MEFDWADPNVRKANLWHILSQHPEMLSSAFIERVFTTTSGDETFATEVRGTKTFLVMEKTYRKRLYRIVFRTKGQHIHITTAFPISKRRN
jgi:hypothetical protein